MAKVPFGATLEMNLIVTLSRKKMHGVGSNPHGSVRIAPIDKYLLALPTLCALASEAASGNHAPQNHLAAIPLFAVLISTIIYLECHRACFLVQILVC